MNTKAWWGTRDHPTRRMVWEIVSMKRFFPKVCIVNEHKGKYSYIMLEILKLDLDISNDIPSWDVEFKIYENDKEITGLDEKFHLRISYPTDYPDKAPKITLPSHNLNNSPHLSGIDGGIDVEGAWDASYFAGTEFMKSIKWIRAWLNWKKNGSWLSEGG